MKMATEDFGRLKAAIEVLDTPTRRTQYAGATDTRYRWDLFWLTDTRWIVDARLNDDHIDTALRRIVPPLA